MNRTAKTEGTNAKNPYFAISAAVAQPVPVPKTTVVMAGGVAQA